MIRSQGMVAVRFLMLVMIWTGDLRANTGPGMTDADFLLLPSGSLPRAELFQKLRGWKFERTHGGADNFAFEALVFFTETLEDATDKAGVRSESAAPLYERFEYFVCKREILDAFYVFPTAELETIVANALRSDNRARRRAGLLAAAAVSDAPGIRRQLLDTAARVRDDRERGEAVLAVLALGEGRTRETLAACRSLNPAAQPVRDAASVAVRRLAATLGEYRVPPIDPDVAPEPGAFLPNAEQSAASDTALLWRAGAFEDKTARAFSAMLERGGTVLIMNPRVIDWPAGLRRWAKENGVALPAGPEQSRGPGRIHYPDYRAFCDRPYHIAEEQGSAADSVWRIWGRDQDAPVRTFTGSGAMVVVQERVLGNGRIVFSTVNLDTKGVYRQNMLRWLYGDALLVLPDSRLYEVDHTILTPHRSWASDWAPGAPRVRWVSAGKRGLIETRQRVAMDASYTPFDAFKASSTAWSGEGVYRRARTDQGFAGQDSVILMGQRAVALIEADLATLDVLVLEAGSVNMLRGSMTHSHVAEVDFNAVPARLRRRILRRVAEGMGFVLLGSTPAGASDRTLSEALHRFIGPMLPFDSRARIESNVSARSIGRGRWIRCDEGLGIRHLDAQRRHIRQLPAALQAPGVLGSLSLIDAEDYTYAMLGKTILWAARRDDVPVITGLDGARSGANAVSLRLSLAAPFDGLLEGVFRNRYGETVSFGPVPVEGDRARLPLPNSLLEDNYVVEAVLKSRDGKTVNFAAARIEVALPVTVTETDTGAAFHREGETIELSARLSAPFDGEAAVKVRDNYGRLVYATRKPVVPETTVLEFGIPVDRPLTRRWEAEILLTRGGRVVARTLRPLGIALPPPPLDFHTETSLPPWPLEEVFREKLAANLLYGGTHTVDTGLRYNFDFTGSSWGTNLGEPGNWVESTQPNVLAFSPSDPGARYEILRAVREHAPSMAELGINSYMIADELFHGPRTFGPASLCPYSRERFRLWLRSEYEDLDALNREWGTDHESWSDVRPMRGADPRRRGSHVDYRRFQVWEFADSARIFEIAGGDDMPDFAAGYSGTGAWNALLEFSGWFACYGVQERVAAVMRREKNRVIGAWYHPGYMFREDHEATCRRWPWWHLFRGTTRMKLWFTEGSPAVHSDLRIYKSFLWLGEEMRELRGTGLGKLLLHARRDEGRAAVYTSDRARVVRRTLAELNDAGWAGVRDPAAEFVSRLIECRHISEYQVERGEIGRRGLKLLMLPATVSLSGREREALRRFVHGGGVLVADFAPGTRNKHGTWTGDAFARELFGVSAGEGSRQIEASHVRFGAPSQLASFPALRALQEWTVDCVGTGLVLLDGKALATTAEGTPVLVVKQTGSGTGVLLNVPFPNGHRSGGAFVVDLSALAGIAPMAELDAGDKELPRVDFGLFRDGGVFYAGFVAEGEGGMIERETVVDTRATFPARRHLYDARAGLYLGETATVDWPLTPGIASLYAGLPARLLELRAAPAREQYARGDVLEIRISCVCDANETWRHVLRVRAMRPDGTRKDAYSRTMVAENGFAILRLPLALDAAPGEWTFAFRDAATGVEGTCLVPVGE